jgi:hypothetical protein
VSTARRALTCAILAIPLAAACDAEPRARTGSAADRGGVVGAAVVGKGVELRIPGSGGEIAIAADALALGDDGVAVFDGDVRVTFAVEPDAGELR